MTRTKAIRLAILGSASALSVAGIAFLMSRAQDAAPGWLGTAIASPLAVRCTVIVVAGLIALGVVAALIVGLEPRGHKGRAGHIHGDQGGTAAVEMTLLFPVAAMIFLIIIQAALLFNANMVVHYSSFAAARVATVVVPLDLGDEERNLVWNPDIAANPPSEKLDLIRRAAVLALLPISGRLSATDEGMGVGGGTTVQGASQSAYDRLKDARAREDPQWLDRLTGVYANKADPSFERPWWLRRVREQYNYANQFTKVELALPWHWRNDGDPDNDCPYRSRRRGEWTDWGWSYISYCPYYHEIDGSGLQRMDYGWSETLAVKVEFKFPLQVPYAGVLMRDPDGQVKADGKDINVSLIRVVGVLSNEGGMELRPQD